VSETEPPLDRLRSGNERFASGQSAHPHADSGRIASTAAEGQHPFAAIVACSDSRVPVELLFDQGIGDLFVIRVAGNVCAIDETGSIEYVVEHLGTTLLVVMGHAGCGAVTAVANGADERGNLSGLVSHIRPSIDVVRREHPELTGQSLVSAAIEQNIWHSIEDVITHSRTVRAAVKAGRLSIVGAVYDIATGRIRWLGVHPDQDDLIEHSTMDAFEIAESGKQDDHIETEQSPHH
jgi:carbonic anhydrase